MGTSRKSMMDLAAIPTRNEAAPLFRNSRKDALLVLAAVAHAGAVMALATRSVASPFGAVAAVLGLAVALAWTSNTVAHVHLHTPIFRAAAMNRALSLLLSVATGVPQTIWKLRHLWHHAGEPVALRRPALSAFGRVEVGAVIASWIALAIVAPKFALVVYAPSYALGLLLCRLQGAMEHGPSGEAVSHYGALYNVLWFNDGYHVEHHLRPTEHWTRLPARRVAARGSALPPFVRFLETLPATLLGLLERMPLAFAPVRTFMIAVHRRALARALEGRPLPRRVAIVGGGLFPRTVLALRPLVPDAELVVIDASAESIAIARAHLAHDPDGERGVTFVRALWDERDGFDVIVFPLAYVGDRDALYRRSRATRLVHDWAFRRRGDRGHLVSALLLKRLNVVEPSP